MVTVMKSGVGSIKKFAYDYYNLLLVNASLNRQKGAKGPVE